VSTSSLRLTDMAVKNLPIPTSGQITYDDDGSPLKVRVSETGVKTFLVFVGSGRRHTIGRYGDITLQQARAAAVRVKAEKTLGRVFPESMALSSARELYLSQIKVRPKTRDYYVRHLNKLKAPQVRDVTPRDINKILDVLPTASRTQALASFRPFFKWCIKRGYLDRSPCELMTGEASNDRERVLTGYELKSVWHACGECGQFGVIVKILMLNAQRKNEIARLDTSWVNDDETILFPGEVTKNKRQHLLPIGSIVSRLLPTVHFDRSKNSGLFFPARGKTNKPFSGWSKCKRDLDKAISAKCIESGLPDWPTINPWTLHDLRRTASTMWAEIGIPQHINDKLLNHVTGSKQSRVARIYNRYEYLAEKRDALLLWEKRVAEIVSTDHVSGVPKGKVRTHRLPRAERGQARHAAT
jgi:integrase